tara:strand:+ start:48 stop:269 length:222 start_codon:yes stop_codon:yes gene_type:complete
MKRCLSIAEAANYVGVSVNTFEKLCADGIMPPARRLGERKVVWDVRSLDRYIDELPIKVAEKSSSWGEALGKD